MYIKQATVNNQVGLHARPATFFIQKANEFKSTIWVEKDEQRVNAKSLLGVLSLGIIKSSTIDLIADGTDERTLSTPWWNSSAPISQTEFRTEGFRPGETRGEKRRNSRRFFHSQSRRRWEARPLRN